MESLLDILNLYGRAKCCKEQDIVFLDLKELLAECLSHLDKTIKIKCIDISGVNRVFVTLGCARINIAIMFDTSHNLFNYNFRYCKTIIGTDSSGVTLYGGRAKYVNVKNKNLVEQLDSIKYLHIALHDAKYKNVCHFYSNEVCDPVPNRRLKIRTTTPYVDNSLIKYTKLIYDGQYCKGVLYTCQSHELQEILKFHPKKLRVIGNNIEPLFNADIEYVELLTTTSCANIKQLLNNSSIKKLLVTCDGEIKFDIPSHLMYFECYYEYQYFNYVPRSKLIKNWLNMQQNIKSARNV